MAKRGRESFGKREREKTRLERQSVKRAKRLERDDSSDAGTTRAEEDELMRQFAELSGRYEANEMTAEQFAEERHRIFAALGLEEGT